MSTTIQNNSFESALSQLGHSLTSSKSTSTIQSKQACILTLLKIIDNILSDPNKSNVKLRKLKVANKNGPFYKRAGKWLGSIDFLIECGFVGSSSGSSSNKSNVNNSIAASGDVNVDKGESLPTQLKLENEDISKLLQGRKALCSFAINVLNISSSVLPVCPIKDDEGFDGAVTMKKLDAQDTSKVDYTNGVKVPQTLTEPTIPIQTQQQCPLPKQSKQSTTTPTSFSLEQIQQMAQKERDESIIEAKLLNEEKKKKLLSSSATSIDVSKNLATVLLDSEKKQKQMVQDEDVVVRQAAEDERLKKQQEESTWLKQEAATQLQAAAAKKRQLEEMTAAKLVADRKREQEEAVRLKAEAEAAKEIEEKQKLQDLQKQQMKKPNRHAKLAEQAEYERKMSELTITDKAATQLNQSGISDEMTDLLDEIENELNDSWFDESPDNEVEEDVGRRDNKDAVKDDGRRYMDPSADTASLCEHENEEMMVEEEEEPVAADSSIGNDDHQGISEVASSPRVRLEQKHIEETRDTSTSAGTIDNSAGISSSSNPNNMTEANNTQTEPLYLPETVEKLVESSITENIIPSSIQKKDGEERAISQLTVSSDLINNTAPDIKIDKGHERNKSASDLLDDLESDSVSNSSININVSEMIATPKRGNSSIETSSQEKELEKKAVNDTVNTFNREMDQRSALSSSDDDVNNEVPTTTQSILKSASTESADSQHHVADEIAAPLSINSDEDAYTDLFKNIPLPEGEDEDERKFCQGFELCHRCLFSIWSNELSTGDATTSTAGLSNVKRKRLIWEDEEESGGDQNKKPVVLVPLVYVYTTWSYILGLKSNNINHRTGGAGIQQGKMYTWLVSNHQQLSAFDDLPISEELGSSTHLLEASIAVCNYVCKALRDIGLVSIYGADDTSDNSSPSPSSKQPSLFVGIDSNVFNECIQKRGNDITLDDRLLHDCHECLAPLVYPRIIAGAANDNTYDPLSKNLVWYSCRHAVRHLIESGSLEKAKLLLFDDTFIRQRLQTMGLLEATTAYCRDCSRMNVCIAESLDEWRRKQLQDADMKRELSTSPMDDYGYHGSTANHPPDVESWNEDHFKILCSVSKVLREKAEEVRAADNYDESMRRNIQKDIGNAMQMIGECIGDIGVHRAQEMEHYEEALRLKGEAYGDDQNHPEVADILVSFLFDCVRPINVLTS